MTPARLVLLMTFVVLMFNSGGRFLLGLTLHPMTLDLGWSRTTLSSAVTVFMLVSALALPFVGRLVDNVGAYSVLAIGVIVSGVAVAFMGLVETRQQVWVLYGVIFALGSAATSVTPVGVLVTQWFPRRAGLANSVAIAGMGVGQLLIISALAAQLGNLGWRGSYALVGVATVVFALPLVWLVSRVSPSGNAAQASTQTPRQPTDEKRFTTIGQALKSVRFCLVLVVYVICGFQDFFIATHIVAFALDEGVAGVLAGHMLALMGLAGLLGVLLSGILNDRFGPVLPTLVNFIIRVVLFSLLFVSREGWAIVTAALLYGATFWMTAPLAVVFARVFCAFTLLGALSGLITMSHHIAGGLGALFGARVFDLYGSYHTAMLIMLGLSVLGLTLTPLLRRAKIPGA